MPSKFKNVQQKIGNLITKLDQEIWWNKLCLDIIGTLKIYRKGDKGELILKKSRWSTPLRGVLK